MVLGGWVEMADVSEALHTELFLLIYSSDPHLLSPASDLVIWAVIWAAVGSPEMRELPLLPSRSSV